jgi:hypothetical protein
MKQKTKIIAVWILYTLVLVPFIYCLFHTTNMLIAGALILGELFLVLLLSIASRLLLQDKEVTYFTHQVPIKVNLVWALVFIVGYFIQEITNPYVRIVIIGICVWWFIVIVYPLLQKLLQSMRIPDFVEYKIPKLV